MNSESTNSKVEKLRREVEKSEAEAARKRNQLRDLLIENKLESHDDFRAISKDMYGKKERLHRLRIAMSRNEFSIEATEKKLSEKRAKLVRQKEDEENLADEVEEMQSRIEAIKEQLAKQVEAGRTETTNT